MEYNFLINRFFRVEGELYQVVAGVALIGKISEICLVCGKDNLFEAKITEIISARGLEFDLPEEEKMSFLKKMNSLFSENYWCIKCCLLHPYLRGD